MKVTYTPEDGDAQAWDFSHGRVRASEAEMCERRLEGTKWDAFEAELLQGSARARRVLLWHLLRRAHPGMRWEDTPDFCMGDLVVEMDLADSRRYRDRMAAMPPTPEVTAALSTMDAAIADLEAREGAEGKAPSLPSGNVTGSPSPKTSTSRRGSRDVSPPTS